MLPGPSSLEGSSLADCETSGICGQVAFGFTPGFVAPPGFGEQAEFAHQRGLRERRRRVLGDQPFQTRDGLVDVAVARRFGRVFE